MKLPIFRKIAACFYAVLLLFTLILGIVFVYLFREHTIKIHREQMTGQAVAIAETLSRYSGNRTGVYRMYQRLLEQISVVDVWIVDNRLNVQSMCGHDTHREHSRQNDIPPLPPEAQAIINTVLEGTISFGREFSDILKMPTLTVGVPIYDRFGSVNGAILLHSPVSGINDSIRQTVYALCIGALTAGAAATAAAFLLSRMFTQPLLQTARTVALLADGKYENRCGIAAQDEIGELAAAVDSLAARLSETEQERQSLDRMREEFVANISHELRTPVAVLKGSVEVLRNGIISEPAEIAEYYTQMQKETEHLERLVNDLLDLSRLQDQRFRLEKTDIELHNVIQDVARAIRRVADQKSVRIATDCTDADCLIFADYGRIRQLLIILLDNAVKFSHAGGTVSLSLSRTDKNITVCVCDNGPGISEAEQPYIFDRFYKASAGSRAHSSGGTGLGLAIARQIAERHDADISVVCAGGETRFSVVFTVK